MARRAEGRRGPHEDRARLGHRRRCRRASIACASRRATSPRTRPIRSSSTRSSRDTVARRQHASSHRALDVAGRRLRARVVDGTSPIARVDVADRRQDRLAPARARRRRLRHHRRERRHRRLSRGPAGLAHRRRARVRRRRQRRLARHRSEVGLTSVSWPAACGTHQAMGAAVELPPRDAIFRGFSAGSCRALDRRGALGACGRLGTTCESSRERLGRRTLSITVPVSRVRLTWETRELGNLLRSTLFDFFSRVALPFAFAGGVLLAACGGTENRSSFRASEPAGEQSAPGGGSTTFNPSDAGGRGEGGEPREPALRCRRAILHAGRRRDHAAGLRRRVRHAAERGCLGPRRLSDWQDERRLRSEVRRRRILAASTESRARKARTARPASIASKERRAPSAGDTAARVRARTSRRRTAVRRSATSASSSIRTSISTRRRCACRSRRASSSATVSAGTRRPARLSPTRATPAACPRGTRRPVSLADQEHCDSGLTCLGSPGDRRCYKLCRVEGADCAPMQTCTTGSIFQDTTFGVCKED